MLTSYLAVLPQFLAPDAPVPALVLFAVTPSTLRRAMDAVTGCALLGFSAWLALEHG